MSEIGRNSRGQLTVECLRCGQSFQIAGRTLLDGGDSNCPACGVTYQSDGSAGKEIDKSIDRLRQEIKKINRKLK